MTGIAVTHIVVFWFDRFRAGTFLLAFVEDILFSGASSCNRHYHLLKPSISFSPGTVGTFSPMALLGSHSLPGGPEGSCLRFGQGGSLPGISHPGKWPLWTCSLPSVYFSALPPSCLSKPLPVDFLRCESGPASVPNTLQGTQAKLSK